MTPETCSKEGCRKPPVEGSRYCELHLAVWGPRLKKIAIALGTGLATVIVIIRPGKGRGS